MEGAGNYDVARAAQICVNAKNLIWTSQPHGPDPDSPAMKVFSGTQHIAAKAAGVNGRPMWRAAASNSRV